MLLMTCMYAKNVYNCKFQPTPSNVVQIGLWHELLIYSHIAEYYDTTMM